jgi:uncharacterized phage protein gp47/JayE
MAVQLTTLNEILGKMIRKIMADTAVNDISAGSVLLDLLEAAASQDFENNAAILSVLETLSIDSLKNADLDNRAADYGLVRIPATKATGFIKIIDSSIVKQSTTLYASKPAPVAGSTKIYVNNAENWTPTGDIYIGRGTRQFEGPIPYSSIQSFGSYYQINLTSALKKDHLISDSVVNAQGTSDRTVAAGTSVKIPSNNESPEISYSTIRDAIIPAGEDYVNDVPIVSLSTGSSNNARIGTITVFSSLPFTGATVINTNALSDGRDIESDDDLRERIKTHASTLARGTRQAILSSIIGVSDASDAKQVYSATISEPSTLGEPSIVYIDDGSGFQPSFQGQSVDVLLSSANGDEEFLQLANFPIPRPQIINETDGPYELSNGMSLTVSVDGEEEEIFFYSSEFNNIAAATPSEIVNVINSKALNFRSRLSNSSSRILLYTKSYDAEYIQVSELKTGESVSTHANYIIKFSTAVQSYITLYKNNSTLTEKETSASIKTNFFSQWGIVDDGGSVILEVDGTPPQERFFYSQDFGFEIGESLNTVSLSEWVEAFNTKFAGITASETSSGRMVLKSNKTGTSSKIKIVGGTYLSNFFNGSQLESTGKNSDFALNRQNGNIQIKTKISKGDTISAGVLDARGSIFSKVTTSGSYDLSSDSYGRSSEMVMVADGKYVTPRSNLSMPIGSTIKIEASGNKMRIIGSNNSMFAGAQINDYIFISKTAKSITSTATWPKENNCGLFKITNKGAHTEAGVNSYLDVQNISFTAGGPYVVQSSDDIQIFSSDTYPQRWKSSLIYGDSTLKNISDSINNNISNVDSSIFKNSSIKISSTTENNGAISIPVSTGKISSIISSRQGSVLGNQSHTANKTTSKDLFSIFKRTDPTATYLDRYTHKDLASTLSTSVSPNTSLTEEYSEEVSSEIFNDGDMSHDDLLNLTSGSNKSLFRSIKEFNEDNKLKTQTNKLKTIFDHIQGDEVQALRPLSISSDDSIVVVADKDTSNKTINVNLWRTGRINSLITPTNSSFSADDADAEDNINFGTPAIWSKEDSGAEFKDYAVWMRSHNWYKSDSGATMIVRAKEYGPNGDKHTFVLDYPAQQNANSQISHLNSVSGTVTTMTFASDEARTISIGDSPKFRVEALTDGNKRYIFQEDVIDLSDVVAGDVLSVSCSTENSGTFNILAVKNSTTEEDTEKYIDIYNPSGVVTDVGSPAVTEITVSTDDVVGTSTVHTISCAPGGSIGETKYIILYTSATTAVVFWYRIQNDGVLYTTPPNVTITGVTLRSVRAANVATTASGENIADILSTAINNDIDFTASKVGSTITASVVKHGSVPVGYTNSDPTWIEMYPPPIGATVSVRSTIEHDSKLYIGTSNHQVWSYDGNQWLDVSYSGWDSLAGGINSMASFNGDLYASINDGNVSSGNTYTSIWKYDGTSWSNTNATWAFGSYSISDMVVFQGKLYAGSENRLVGGVFENVIYRYDGTTWVNTTPTWTIIPNAIESMIVFDNKLIVGTFAGSGAQVWSYNGSTWANITGSWTSADNSVNGMAVYSSKLYACIDQKIFRYNDTGTSWTDVTPITEWTGNTTRSAAVYGSKLYIGTQNSSSGGQLWRYNGAAWEKINSATGWTSSNKSISNILVFDERLYVSSDDLGNSGEFWYYSYAFEIDRTIDGTSDITLGGKYFKIQDLNGSVGVWFDVYGETIPTSVVALSRSIRVDLEPGDTKNEIAEKIKIALDLDTKFISTGPILVSGNAVITVTDKYNGVRVATTTETATTAESATTHLSVSSFTPGVNDEYEAIEKISIFPLLENDIQSICNKINTSETLVAVPVGNAALVIDKATREEVGGNLAYDHEVGDSFISLWDGQSFIREFNNTNPHFILKKSLILNSAPPGDTFLYNPATCPNHDSDKLGEFFKLVPRTIENIKHHMSHRALSQLPIVSDLSVASNFRRLQIKSKKLGTSGAIEIAGGRGNDAEFYIIGDSDTTSDLVLTTSAYPFTISSEDFVEIYNENQTKRKSRLQSQDSIGVEREGVTDSFNFLMNPKVTGFSTSTNWTITDVSATIEYDKAAGIIWRWAATGTGLDFALIKAGDVLTPYELLSWASGNKLNEDDDSGFPIIKVNATSKYIDILNPNGQAMSSTSQGAIGAVEVCPTYSLKFKLKHSTSSTKYSIEKLGYGDLVKLKRVSGASPYFIDCGAAVDDFIVIKGSTFNSLNSGRYRILAVDNDYVIFKNSNAVEQLNTLNKFTSATWVSGSSSVTVSNSNLGALDLTDTWIKKKEDTDDKFVQVLSTSLAGGIVTITLGSAYTGASGISDGVSFDQELSVNGGVALQSVSDISVYECDSAVADDYLVIDSVAYGGTSANTWFSSSNSGTRKITHVGIDTTTKRPLLRVENSNGLEEPEDINLSISGGLDGFYVKEGEDNKYKTIRKVEYTAISPSNSNQRNVYVSPIDRGYKMSQVNGTKIKSMGKIGFDLGITTGIDGYNYYTGLMRTVQRVIDGFEPEISTYPGRRALGSRIEVMPPITVEISLILNITTRYGVNLTDVISDAKSVIVQYVNGLGVGDDVILSEIITRVMSIYGVEAVTFTTPSPSEERIFILSDQKALTKPELISIS